MLLKAEKLCQVAEKVVVWLIAEKIHQQICMELAELGYCVALFTNRFVLNWLS